MKRVASLLEKSRLVTLTGAAGVGKTRLALEVSARLVGRYRDGVHVIELGVVTEAQNVSTAMEAALGVPHHSGGEVDGLVAHMAGSQMLIVLDNCEHLAEPSAEMADAILRRCAKVSILATSQQRLGVAGELALQVPPLSLPGADAGADPDLLPGAEAVALFCARAAAVDAGFELNDETAPAVAAICRRLDGIPLAIELAAARVEVLPPAQIAARLDERFALLSGGTRTTVARHRTLRAALDWSYQLLSERESVLLSYMSVFSGGAVIEAVGEVCGEGAGDPETFNDLASLVAKSWVVADRSGSEARYRLLETVRHYASEHLSEVGMVNHVRHRHAQFFMAFAERAEPELDGPRRREWLEALEAEHDNFRAALDWALGESHPDIALRLASGLAPFWYNRGHLTEGRRWLETALAQDTSLPAPARAKALREAATLAVMLGDVASARTKLEDSLRLSVEADDGAGRALALTGLGFVAMLNSDPSTAFAMLDEGLTLARAVADDDVILASLSAAARIRMFAGDASAARPFYEESLEVAARVGNVQVLDQAVGGLGWALAASGDYKEAERLFTDGLRKARQAGALQTVALTLTLVANLARVRGNYRKAKSMAEEGLVLARQIAAPFLIERCLLELASVAVAEGELADAERLYEQAVDFSSGWQPGNGGPRPLIGMGRVKMAQGDVAGARPWLAGALDVATKTGERVGQAAALLASGDLAWQSAEDEQAASNFHQALTIYHAANSPSGVVDSLEALSRLASGAGRHDRAARLLGAAQALRDSPKVCYVRPPSERMEHENMLTALRENLGVLEFEAAWREGAAMSVDDAVAYAGRGRKGSDRPRSGWASLTTAEREVVKLVRERLSNAEIGQRLFISPRTVQSHLAHIFAKVGVSTRRQLAEELTRHEENESSRRRQS